jgi:hypothetical protein
MVLADKCPMQKGKQILADITTFGMIAIVGALFGYSNAGALVILTGRVVCCVSTVLIALSLFVKRPPGSPL